MIYLLIAPNLLNAFIKSDRVLHTKDKKLIGNRAWEKYKKLIERQS